MGTSWGRVELVSVAGLGLNVNTVGTAFSFRRCTRDGVILGTKIDLSSTKQSLSKCFPQTFEYLFGLKLSLLILTIHLAKRPGLFNGNE